MAGFAHDDLQTVVDVGLHHALQVELHGLVVDDRYHVDAVACLQHGVLPELLQHDLAHGIFFYLKDDAQAAAAALVANMADALYCLVPDEVADFL